MIPSMIINCKKMDKNILLTGKPGVGKTTIIQKAIDRLPPVIETGGFITCEIRENAKRTGFKIKSLDGKEAILAHVDIDSSYNVSKYGVDIEALDSVAVDSILSSLDKDIIIIDEIGKMELFSRKFKDAVKKALNQRKVLGTIKSSDDSFTDKIRKRKDVDVIEVTKQNRDSLTSELIR